MVPAHKPNGVLTVEHNGFPSEEHDGLALTVLVSIKLPLEDVTITNTDYTWLEISNMVGQKLIARIAKNMTVQLNVIR